MTEHSCSRLYLKDSGKVFSEEKIDEVSVMLKDIYDDRLAIEWKEYKNENYSSGGATLELTEEEKNTFKEAGELLYNFITYSLPPDLNTLVSENNRVPMYEVQRISSFLYGLAGGIYSLE